MAIKLSVEVRNARLDAIETAIGASPVLKIRSGTPPANASDPDVGTVLATINLPADWMNNATAGIKTMSGTWADTSADAGGTATHFRIYNSGGSCRMQGTCGVGTGDLQMDSVDISAGQNITITSFTLTDGNA